MAFLSKSTGIARTLSSQGIAFQVRGSLHVQVESCYHGVLPSLRFSFHLRHNASNVNYQMRVLFL